MQSWKRYPKLLLAFFRHCLVRELSFRSSFIIRTIAGLGWLFLLLFFFHLVFLKTARIGSWSHEQYLIFQATSMLMNAILAGFFLENLTEFAELIRSGDLDIALTKPIDEQFFISFQRIDWTELVRIPFIFGIFVYAYRQQPFDISPGRLLIFSLLVIAGVVVMYSLMLLLASTSVWIVRNSGLYEAWFYMTQFARYPSDVYQGHWVGISLSFLLSFILPIMLAISLPARLLAGIETQSWLAFYLVMAAIVLFAFSRWFFRVAIRHYRSASS